jgi:hypothetical protein
MTSRQRVEASFQHQPPDRTPVFEYVLLPPVAEQILGRSFVEYLGGMQPWIEVAESEGFERTLRGYARARVELAARLGHDLMCISPNPVPGESYFYDPLDELGSHFELKESGDPVQRLRERNQQVSESMLGDLPRDCYLVYELVR